jgi:hypothetical protein
VLDASAWLGHAAEGTVLAALPPTGKEETP